MRESPWETVCGDDVTRRHKSGGRVQSPGELATPLLQRSSRRGRCARWICCLPLLPGEEASGSGHKCNHQKKTSHSQESRETHTRTKPLSFLDIGPSFCLWRFTTATTTPIKMLRAHKGTKPETLIDGVRQHWALAPETGCPPCSSHASVAHTATRSSSQGPASALRFNF